MEKYVSIRVNYEIKQLLLNTYMIHLADTTDWWSFVHLFLSPPPSQSLGFTAVVNVLQNASILSNTNR